MARARAAVDDLAGVVVGYPSPALEAGRQVALARVLLAEGDAAGAVRELRAAVRGWREVGAPYEIARARAVLARALRALETTRTPTWSCGPRSTSSSGSGRASTSPPPSASSGTPRTAGAAPVQIRKTFMFTDIVGSTNLAEALGDEAWERLLRWHDDTLRGLVASGGGEIVNSTGDGFFVAFDSARRGVDCAVSIQRALRDHRDSTGFATSVRIGLHTAEANRRGTDYSGMGVHVAARVAALAGGGEILATAETLAEAGDVATTDAREAPVKGVTAPVSLASIAWT